MDSSKSSNVEVIYPGDIFKSGCEMLVHQTNCIVGGPYGIGAGLYTIMTQKYPYCNVYQRRKHSNNKKFASDENRGIPGEINIDHPVNSTGPIIVGINGQYGISKTGTKNFDKYIKFPPEYSTESHEMRENWFKEGLSKLRNYILTNSSIKTVAFPYFIGCDLAGGIWNNYFAMIQEFASNQDQFKVKIHRLK